MINKVNSNNVNGIVYKISFPNGKNYIGITSCDIKTRQKGHMYAAKSHKTRSRCLYKALKEYGKIETNFCEEIDTANSLEELY